MFKRLALLVCLLAVSTTHFAMIYDEDDDNILFMGVLTQPGERYPVGLGKKIAIIKPLKEELNQERGKKEKSRDANCLSILNFLLQQYEHAQPIHFLML